MRVILVLYAAVFLLSSTEAKQVNTSSENAKRVVCYYTFPTSTYTLQPEDVDVNICTHIVVGFVSLDNCSITISDEQKKAIEEVVLLKKKNANLKVLLSIGGGGGTFGFPEMVETSQNRSRFIQSMKNVIGQLDLDGIDLDWEFPDDILRNNRKNFINLLEDIRDNINNSARKYLISAAVAAPITLVETSYDVADINRLVDFINLMSYDYNFFSTLTPWTGMNAPLYARSSDFFYFATQNIAYTSKFWATKGMSKDKINVGIPVYAHTYTLASENNTYLGAPATGNGVLGGEGSARYGTVCQFMQDQNLKTVFDDETKSPYVTNGTEWVSFENDESIKYKTEYVRDNGFGGVMVFSLSSDDYEGICKRGVKFPNTKMIYNIFVN